MELKDICVIHITHIDNLSSIIADDCLYSDAKSIERASCNQQIGMSKIKQRRLQLNVSCHPGTTVGDYVPFYFWHHSPMLYLIHIGSAELDYQGGQDSIIHLVSKMQTGIEWADKNEKKWTFTSGNAGAYWCDFYQRIDDLVEVNWDAVYKKYWSDCKDEKQAEFLVQDNFHFSLFSHIVVKNQKMKSKVDAIMQGHGHQPAVAVAPDWYYN